MAFSTPDTHITGYVVTANDWNELVNNDNAINSFFRQNLWPDLEAHAPLSGTTAAGISIVESTDAGTNKPLIPIMSYDAAQDEGRQFVCRWPRGYGVSATLVGSYYMASANVSKTVSLYGVVCALSDGDTSADAAAYDSVNAVEESVPDAAKTVDEFSITLTNADSIVANDWVNILFIRDGDGTTNTDDASGDMQVKTLAVDFDLAT